uniref:Transposase MuDR plant domain-containing protein n=1 Tax=Oryza rufipogon TaxID=4529 RepID=A0A0E0QI25_ORYRU
MDVLNTFQVTFHFNRDFVVSGREKHYVGGSEAMSYLDQDKVSLPKIVGHLHDHYKVGEGTMLHLLFPGKDLNSELRALLDDDSMCQYMNDCIVDGGVAEVYADAPILVDLSYEDEGSDYELEMEEDMGDESDGNWVEQVDMESDNAEMEQVGMEGDNAEVQQVGMEGDNAEAEAEQVHDLEPLATQTPDLTEEAEPMPMSQALLEVVSRVGIGRHLHLLPLAPMEHLQIVKINAKAKVATQQGGSACVNLQAIVSHSQASTSASIQIKSGKASISLSVQEPAKKGNKSQHVRPAKKAKKKVQLDHSFCSHLGNLISCDSLFVGFVMQTMVYVMPDSKAPTFILCNLACQTLRLVSVI